MQIVIINVTLSRPAHIFGKVNFVIVCEFEIARVRTLEGLHEMSSGCFLTWLAPSTLIGSFLDLPFGRRVLRVFVSTKKWTSSKSQRSRRKNRT